MRVGEEGEGRRGEKRGGEGVKDGKRRKGEKRRGGKGGEGGRKYIWKECRGVLIGVLVEEKNGDAERLT